MTCKNLMYISAAIFFLAATICISVFTYISLSRVKISCEVGHIKATCYVASGDEESISLLYAQLVHAIKNSEKVYRDKCAVQQSYFNPSKFQQRAIERAIAKSAKRNSECKKEDAIVNTTTYIQPELSPEIKRQLYENIVNWDSTIKSDLQH